MKIIVCGAGEVGANIPVFSVENLTIGYAPDQDLLAADPGSPREDNGDLKEASVAIGLSLIKSSSSFLFLQNGQFLFLNLSYPIQKNWTL